MNHLVRTQVIEVRIAREEEAFPLQARLSQWYYQMIVPVLQRTFDEFASGDEVIQLDLLEIELGTIRLAEIDTQDFAERLRNKLGEQLLTVAVSARKKEEWKKPRHMSVTSQWMYYMQHGHLPWNVTGIDSDWYRQVLEGFATDVVCIEAVRRLIVTDSRALTRIVSVSTPDFLIHLLESLTSRKQEMLQEMLEALHSVWRAFNDGQAATRLIRKIWEAVLNDVMVSGPLAIERISVPLIRRHASPERVIQFVQYLKSRQELWALAAAFEQPFTDHFESHRPQDLSTVRTSETVPIQNQIPREGIFVPHAGLVLLHPFLNNLFVYLGLVNNGAFESTDSQQKALVVLHFLCMGNANYEEHELVVPRILCHCGVEDLVDPGISLTVHEQQECNALLQEVVYRWSILKNTSIDALRSTFLQRGGKLYVLANEPHLLVEDNVLDVLLDKLPWGLGIIKLPWMTHMLKVEWR
jgi:hypothetical protein